MPLPLLTRRLAIRPLAAADAGDVMTVYGDPEVMRYWNGSALADRLEARAWAREQGEAHAERGFAQWRLSERAGARFVGCLGLQPLEDEVEILYALAPAMWGRGYATEAGEAALEYAFAEVGLECVVGIVRAANEASLRVLRRLGMRPAGPAEYWGSLWERFTLTAGEWRDGLAAARLPLRTERLKLRGFAAGDLEALCAVFGDPEVMRYVGVERRPLERAQLAASQERVREHWDEHGFGPLAVVERASGTLVGEAGLQVLDGGPEVELTYTLARAAGGRGYATEAARAALAWGFAGLRLQRIVAVAYPRNVASLKVIAKLGMAPEGTQFCYGATLAKFGLAIDDWRAGAGASGA
jgi:[ribosomal protein S5]-alanine N-acetyltransferase